MYTPEGDILDFNINLQIFFTFFIFFTYITVGRNI